MTQLDDFGTSPTKPLIFSKTDNLPERSLAAHEERAVGGTDSFETNFLNFPSKVYMSKIAKAVSDWVSEVEDSKTQVEGYQNISALLNEITQLLHEEYDYTSVVYFFASGTQHPLHHPCGNQDTPDFLAMVEDDYNKLDDEPPSWHYLVSLGEWKPGKALTKDELAQTGAHAGSLNQARPDNPSTLVFAACRGCYVIGYSDPTTWTITESIPWKNLDPLVAYIHSLHIPRVQTKDGTITLVDRGISESPHWRIRDAAFDIDCDFEIIYVGRAHSRMTTVFRSVQSQGPLLVKDAWIKSYRNPESILFASLASDGAPPGWVTIRTPTKARPELQTPNLVGITQRKKDRTVMDNTGHPFDRCRKLSDAIAAAYDILEADRWAVTKRRILYRDVSAPNILISPAVSSTARDGARFIQGILNPTTEASSALLLDLDNGVLLPDTHLSLDVLLQNESNEVLRQLSGTPMYIARGPSMGFYGISIHAFPTLPTLREPISQLYADAYPDDALRSATGPVGTLNQDYHERFDGKRVIQRPWHDAESAMLTLLLFLLRCSPEGSPKESQDQLLPMQRLYSRIWDSGIGFVPDSRDDLLSASRSCWKAYLHQGLNNLVDNISKVCSAVSPDYEFLEPTSDSIDVEVVLHEVLQRQLLNWYYEITTVSPELDITFSQELRPVPAGQAREAIVVLESGSKYARNIEHGVGPIHTGGAALEAGPSDVGGHSMEGSRMVAGSSGEVGFRDMDLGTSSMGAGPSSIHSRPGTKHAREESSSQELMPATKRRKKPVLTSEPERQSERVRGMAHRNYNEDSESESESSTGTKDKKGKGKARQRRQ